MLVTNDPSLADRMQLLRNHGEVVISRRSKEEHQFGILGMNMRLGEIEGAIGKNQLRKLDGAVASRQRAAKRFEIGLKDLIGLKTPFIETENTKKLFKSDTYVWVDAGINQHIPKELVCLQSITRMAGITKSILFTAFEYINAEEVHGFKYEGYRKYTNVVPNWVCRATIFSCKKQYINTFLKEYRYYLKDTLDRGYLGTEESIFTLLSAVNPALYRTRNTGRSSMPVDFLDNLIHNAGTGANI